MDWDRKKYTSLSEKDHLDVEIISKITIKRMELNWTQDELSKRSGVSKRTISKMEDNIVTPKLETLIKICNALGLEILISSKTE